MRSVLTTLLLSIYLIATTELSEVLKIPVLLQHYAEHKTENPKLSFSEFLSIHYNADGKSHEGHDKNTKLPFRSHENYINLALYICPPVSLFLALSDEAYSKKSNYTKYAFYIFCSGYVSRYLATSQRFLKILSFRFLTKCAFLKSAVFPMCLSILHLTQYFYVRQNYIFFYKK